jgi:hypothetical protein
MTTKDVILALRAMNESELNMVIEAIKMQRQFNNRMAVRSVRVGDRVKFNSGRADRGVITGTVQKVNIKNLKVKQDNSFTVWNVPAGIATHITEETNN